jgi:4-carboxymuconolactone decarboxylase
MANVRLIEDAIDAPTRELIESLKSGRRGSLLGIYKALLHNPDLTRSWFTHLNTVRWGVSLPARLRELVIIRVGWRLGSAYILRQHVPKLALQDGVSEEECAQLQNATPAGFAPDELAALEAADELTVSASLSPTLAAKIRTYFDERQFVELSVLIGTYNMHARFVAAIDLPLETG